MLCAIGGSADSGVGFKAISMPSSSSCCSRLSVLVSGPPWNLLQYGCWCLCGLISIPAAILAASVDCSWALWIIASFDVVVMSVGHFNSGSVTFLEIYCSSVGYDVMLFDSFHKSFWIGLSNIFLVSSSDDVRWGP